MKTVTFFIALLASSSASAADITINHTTHEIFIKGEIKDGDAASFDRVVGQLKTSTLSTLEDETILNPKPFYERWATDPLTPSRPARYTVVLESPGGSVNNGLDIGRSIRAKKLTTQVNDASCNSICAIIWLAGDVRMAQSTSLIGFHAAFDAHSKQVAGSPNAIIGIYLHDMGLSDKAIYYLLEAGSDEVKYLTRETAKTLNIAYRGDLPSEGTIQLMLQRAGKSHEQPEPQPSPPSQPAVNDLPSCSSAQVFNILKSIAGRNLIWLFGGNAWELVGGNQNVRFCRALTLSTRGKRYINYYVTRTGQGNQIWVHVTWYSAPQW